MILLTLKITQEMNKMILPIVKMHEILKNKLTLKEQTLTMKQTSNAGVAAAAAVAAFVTVHVTSAAAQDMLADVCIGVADVHTGGINGCIMASDQDIGCKTTIGQLTLN